VTLSAVYAKLNGIEGDERRVRAAYGGAPRVRCRGAGWPTARLCCPAIVSGSLMATTSLLPEHRLPCCAAKPALAGTGLSVILDPALMLATDMIPCEDGHAQERSSSPTSFRPSRRGPLDRGPQPSALCSFLSEIRERRLLRFGIMPTFPSLARDFCVLAVVAPERSLEQRARSFAEKAPRPRFVAYRRPPRQADAGRRHGDWGS
jgi:hypothetical protein